MCLFSTELVSKSCLCKPPLDIPSRLHLDTPHWPCLEWNSLSCPKCPFLLVSYLSQCTHIHSVSKQEYLPPVTSPSPSAPTSSQFNKPPESFKYTSCHCPCLNSSSIPLLLRLLLPMRLVLNSSTLITVTTRPTSNITAVKSTQSLHLVRSYGCPSWAPIALGTYVFVLSLILW